MGGIVGRPLPSFPGPQVTCLKFFPARKETSLGTALLAAVAFLSPPDGPF